MSLAELTDGIYFFSPAAVTTQALKACNDTIDMVSMQNTCLSCI